MADIGWFRAFFIERLNLFGFLKRFFGRLSSSDTGQSSRIFWPRRKAGVYVDHDTALTFGAVFACQRYLANTVAQLPWKVYRRIPGEKGSDYAPTHPADWLLGTRPNPEMSAFNFKRWLVHHAVSWGNAYAEIEFDVSNRPVSMWPIHPSRVTAKRSEDGALYYEISNMRGSKTAIMPSSIFHLAGMGNDGISGYSVVSLAAAAIGAGIAADSFSADFFANGAVLSGGFQHPGKMSLEAHTRLRDQIKEKHTGIGNAWRPIVMEEGISWQTFGMPLKDAEFLAGKNYSVTDIARWFGVPPHKIADLSRATFSNIEQQSIEVVTDAILPWVLPMEQEADTKLISARNRGYFYTKMTLNGLLRGDSAARGAWYQTMRNMGAISADEIREFEDMNPIGAAKGGDKYIVQGQYVPLDKIGEEPLPGPVNNNEDNGNEEVPSPEQGQDG